MTTKKTKKINKQDSKFIQELTDKYLSRVTNHIYFHQHTFGQEQDKLMMIFPTSRKSLYVVKIYTGDNDRITKVSLLDEKWSSKRWYKSQIFHLWRTPNGSIKSIKKTSSLKSMYQEIQQLLLKYDDDLQGKGISRWSSLKNKVKHGSKFYPVKEIKNDIYNIYQDNL